jgi:lipoprotein-releasing system permease protein
MFELSIAKKYLTPRWRQLSVSIISLISILVIALVVWLIVVFFSVTAGLEKSWVGKLIALTAPMRILPTDAYYHSYYYRVDSISEHSNYSLKTISEKLSDEQSNPYDPTRDEEPPAAWPKPDLDGHGNLKDLVKLAYTAINQQSIAPLTATPFEMTAGTMRLQLLRPREGLSLGRETIFDTSSLQQATYLGSFDPSNQIFENALLPLNMQDLNNIYSMLAIDADTLQEDNPSEIHIAPKETVQHRLQTFFRFVAITELQTPQAWTIPPLLFPEKGQLQGLAIYSHQQLHHVIIPASPKNLAALQKQLTKEGVQSQVIRLNFEKKKAYIETPGKPPEPLSPRVSLNIANETILPAALANEQFSQTLKPAEVKFRVAFELQGIPFAGIIRLGNLKFLRAKTVDHFSASPVRPPFWLYKIDENNQIKLQLPVETSIGEGVLLPRPFRDAGILAGDRGFLSYMTPTTSAVQEQRIPIFVAGFYDPGVIPIGGKYVLANPEVTGLIRSAHNQEDTSTASAGINIRFDHLDRADEIKAELMKAFKTAGIAPYWRIETYKEYDFTKDLIQQLHSEKNLFSLIAMIIIIVACSNIISMLIILVNDKKIEIGILRSMGASSLSIATIFGICGMVMGVIGSLVGIAAAMITLKNLQPLINLLSKIQGHEMFNPIFFGETLPTELSVEALGFVIIATTLISLMSGLVPALKASMLRPSAILRSE